MNCSEKIFAAVVLVFVLGVFGLFCFGIGDQNGYDRAFRFYLQQER